MKLIKSVAAITLLLICSLPVAAQTAQRTLAGAVTDSAGAAVPGARLTLKRPTGDIVRIAVADGRGEFRFTGLRPQNYRLLVEADGLVQTGGATEIALDSFSIEDLQIRLSVGALQDGLVVAATRTATRAGDAPSSVFLVSADELLRSGRPSVLDAIRSSPGVTLMQTARRGGVTSLFVRGGESDYTKILIDGIPVNDAGGAFDFSDLTTENAERVEIVRGAQSALYGSDAMSGVVQFVTRRGAGETPELTVSAEGGSFAFNRQWASIAGAAGRFDYATSFAHMRTRGRDRNDDYQNRTASANIGYSFSDRTQLRVTVRNENSGLGAPGATAVIFPDPDERARRRRIAAGARLDDQTTSRWHQSFSFVYSENNQANFDPAAQDLSQASTPPDTFFAFNDFRSFFSNHQRRRGARYQSDLLLPARNLLSAGVEYENERAVFVSGFDGIDRVASDRTNTGVFIQNQFTPVERWSLVAGLRVENNRAEVPASLAAILGSLGSPAPSGNVGFGTKVVPKIATTVVLRSGDAQGAWGATRLRMGYGEGIKAPTLVEAFSPNGFFLGNPLLRPERARTFDAGIEQMLWGDRARIELTWFENRFRDQIAYVGNPATFGGPVTLPDGRLTHFVNFDRARARGLEIGAMLRPVRRFNIGGQYTFLDSQLTAVADVIDFNTLQLAPSPEAGRPLLRRPRHSGAFNAGWIGERWETTLTGLFVGPRRDINPLSFSRLAINEGYARLDWAGAYRATPRATLFARIDNLLNRNYQEVLGYPAYRLNFSAGVRVRVGGLR
ncbi:MAG: TonB-dependent receptor [Acidobacteria bacterium]|nr:TonB-dependent receptor [Acidobacteriota bacterium]MCW5968299.1 TonB-dependent receptor [Blastocatellales bacterium]